jgi:hypothetical protein
MAPGSATQGKRSEVGNSVASSFIQRCTVECHQRECHQTRKETDQHKETKRRGTTWNWVDSVN